jgi:CDP-diacylglycerol--glycerol-3-phosphate 3-phosphatidyltransferase
MFEGLANLANAVTAARLIATPLFVLCAARADESFAAGWVAGLLFAVAAWSDVADGRMARHRGTASDRGRILDHFADIVFVLVALGTYVYLGIAPWWVPASVAASFSFYVADSWIRSAPVKPTLIGSRLGHAGGVANYVLIGVLVFNDSAGLHWLPAQVVDGLFLLVPVYSAASIAARFLGRAEPILKTAGGA